jgi:hypothetical protein
MSDPFMSLKWENLNLTEKLIKHGNRTIVTVKQGEVGYAEDMGSPVLLPPGLHEWTSPTLKFIESVDLNNTCIRLVAPHEIIISFFAMSPPPSPPPTTVVGLDMHERTRVYRGFRCRLGPYTVLTVDEGYGECVPISCFDPKNCLTEIYPFPFPYRIPRAANLVVFDLERQPR